MTGFLSAAIRSAAIRATALDFLMSCAMTSGRVCASAQTPAVDAAGSERHTLITDFYTLNAGDTVDVTFRFTPEFNDEVTVGPDGRATLKSIGLVQLAGRTLDEIKQQIVSGSTDRLVNPEVTVSLKDFERPHVVVAGEVQTPGRFELRHPITALQAVMLAGGPKEDAAMGRVVLFRKLNSETAEVHVLQLHHYDPRTRAKNDLILQPDDMILVQHDKLETFSRYVKLVNLGVYFNPLGNNGAF